jgi:hypothetical protein
MDTTEDLARAAQEILTQNDLGDYTIPAHGLYPHQWLWDSCFIAIGMRHYNLERAQKELLSLLRGQWANGMLPHMVLHSDTIFMRDHNVWRSWINPLSPDDYKTSGITQPPMVAEAVVRIGQKLKQPERRTWYQTMFPALLAHHQWLYTERDPHNEGLVMQIHPWETGMDNIPPWIYELQQHRLPFWIRITSQPYVRTLINLFRGDTHYVPSGERLTAFEAAALYGELRRLRRKSYIVENILPHALFTIEDLGFNSIFIRANHHLRGIAKTIGHKLPEDLLEHMEKTEDALEQLWDAYTGQYYPRNFTTHKLIKISSLETLLPLYAGSISQERAKQLVDLLHDKKAFGPKYPVPSVPVNSDWFKPHGYWQGPTWINTNWLIVDGLKRYGFDEEANHIAQMSLELIQKAGFCEYFSPLDGTPAGADNFSWTAALAIDLCSQ